MLLSFNEELRIFIYKHLLAIYEPKFKVVNIEMIKEISLLVRIYENKDSRPSYSYYFKVVLQNNLVENLELSLPMFESSKVYMENGNIF